MRPQSRRADIGSKARRKDYVPPVKSQSGEFYRESKAYKSGEPSLGAGPKRRMQDGSIDSRLSYRNGHRATWCHRVTEIGKFASKGNHHELHHRQVLPMRVS